MANDIKDVKLIMLSEFENQLDELFEAHYEDFNFDRFIAMLNFFINRWEYCRVDLKNFGDSSNSLKLIEQSKGMNFSFPAWLTTDEGVGCLIESNKNINLKLETISDGNLQISIRGIDFRSFMDANKRIPVYIDFTELKVNDNNLLDENILAWHNTPLRFTLECLNNEKFDLEIKYNTIHDYFPQLKIFLTNISDDEDLLSRYEKIKQYIAIEKFSFQLNEIEKESSELFDFVSQENIKWSEDFNSGLFNSFFKSYYNYTNFSLINDDVNLLNSKIDHLESRLDKLQNISDDYFESNNFLFNTVFLDYKLEPNRLLNNLQTLCTELVVFADKICQKYDIGWWLDGGNLLGAARHENFIPWDDDMDIGMTRKDYHRFIEVMHDEVRNHGLDEHINIYYRHRTWKNKPINAFVQMFVMNPKLGNKVMAGLDVFAFDFMDEYDEASFGPLYNRSQEAFYETLYNGHDRSKVYMGVDYDEVMENYFSILDLSYDEKKYIFPGVEGSFGHNRNLYEIYVLETSEVFPLRRIKYGDHMLSVPNDYHSYLKKFYGEYMEVPKSIHTHRRVNNFRYEPNANEIFEEIIEKFKKVNENF